MMSSTVVIYHRHDHVRVPLEALKQQYHQNLLTESRNSPRLFWKIIKKILPSEKNSIKTKIESVIIDSDRVKTNSKAETFCQFFSNIASRLKQKTDPIQDFIWKAPTRSRKIAQSTFSFDYVSKIFVENELKSFKKVHFEIVWQTFEIYIH